MSAKAIVLVVDDHGWSAASRDATTVDTVALDIARLMGAALLVNGYRVGEPAVIDWPVVSVESELDRARARITELEGQLDNASGDAGDFEVCPDCGDSVLSPSDHKCPNDECPSHDGGDDGD